MSLTEDEISVSPFFTKGLATFTTGRESFAARTRGFLGLFDAISTANTDQPVRAAGIKVALGTIEQAVDLVECLREHLADVRVILIRRNDLVAQCGSLRRAMQTGQWHAFGGARAIDSSMLQIPRDYFDNYIRSCRRIEAQFDRLPETHPVCLFDYERDIAGTFDHVRLFEFLGVDQVEVGWMHMQKVSPPPASFIADYDQLTARMKEIGMPSTEDAIVDRFSRMAETAGEEHLYFLVSRAEARMTRSCHREAECDLRAVLARHPQIDPSMGGKIDALVQALKSTGHSCSGLEKAADLEELNRSHVQFYLQRAAVLVRLELEANALPDLLRITLEFDCPRSSQGWVAHLLERALRTTEPKAALQTAEKVAGRHARSAPFAFLHALAANYYLGPATSRALLSRVLELDPKHERAIALLTSLNS